MTLAYAFGRFEKIWVMPISLVFSIGLANWILNKFLSLLEENRRLAALVLCTVVQLSMMGGMIFLFEWNEPLRWNKTT